MPNHDQLSEPASTVKTAADLSQMVPVVIAYIVEHVAEDITLEELAELFGISRSNFCRRFQRDLGLSPMRWLWSFRATLAAEFLQIDPHWSMTDVAFACGFTSSAHFSRSFKAVFGVSPLTYKKQQLATAKVNARACRTMFLDHSREVALSVAGSLAAPLSVAAGSR